MMGPRLPGLVAAVVVLVAAGLRVGVASPGVPDLPDRLVPVLLATAALCVAGLTLRRGPALAWFAIVLAALIGAVEVVAVIREWEPAPTGEEWLVLTLVAAAATVAAAFVAARYATVRRTGRFGAGVAPALGWIGLGIVVVGEVWAVASATSGVASATIPSVAEPDVVPIRVATRLMLGTVVVLGLVGAARDLMPPARRAWKAGANGDASFPRRLGEELVPAWAESRRAAAQQERANLAAELHARVVPELRSALAATAGAGAGDTLAARLRGTLDDIEGMMAERHSVVLEEFGLLAALEWLAERMQARNSSEVTLEVIEALDAGQPADPVRPPRDVERAAFRVALLAVDNATRHAPGGVAIRTRIGPRAVDLEIVDHGPGLRPERARDAARAGRRGLGDMRAEAVAVGASLVIGGVDPDDRAAPGIRVAFRWPSA